MPFNKYIVTFRMPFYYFLSGCFFKAYSGFLDFTRRKINKLLIPFISFFIILSYLSPCILYYVFHFDLPRLEYGSLLRSLLDCNYPNIAIWFLICLFIINIVSYMLYYLMISFKNGYLLSISILLCLFLLTQIDILEDKYVSTAILNLPYFIGGYLFFRKTKLMHANINNKFLILASLLFFTSCIVLYNLFMPSMIGGYICGFAGIFGILSIAKSITYIPIISYIGRFSIIVLCIHCFIINCSIYLKNYIDIHFCTVKYPVFFITLLTFTLCLCLIPIMRRYMPHITAQKNLL